MYCARAVAVLFAHESLASGGSKLGGNVTALHGIKMSKELNAAALPLL